MAGGRGFVSPIAGQTLQQIQQANTWGIGNAITQGLDFYNKQKDRQEEQSRYEDKRARQGEQDEAARQKQKRASQQQDYEMRQKLGQEAARERAYKMSLPKTESREEWGKWTKAQELAKNNSATAYGYKMLNAIDRGNPIDMKGSSKEFKHRHELDLAIAEYAKNPSERNKTKLIDAQDEVSNDKSRNEDPSATLSRDISRAQAAVTNGIPGAQEKLNKLQSKSTKIQNKEDLTRIKTVTAKEDRAFSVANSVWNFSTDKDGNTEVPIAPEGYAEVEERLIELEAKYGRNKAEQMISREYKLEDPTWGTQKLVSNYLKERGGWMYDTRETPPKPMYRVK